VERFNLPYHSSVAAIRIGAGVRDGNDVAAALRNGAGQVLAVEIDRRF